MVAKIKQTSAFARMSSGVSKGELSTIVDEMARLHAKRRIIELQSAAGHSSSSVAMPRLDEKLEELRQKFAEPSGDSVDRTYFVAVFACVQEVIRELTVTCKDRGGLLLRAVAQLVSEVQRRATGSTMDLLEVVRAIEAEQAKMLAERHELSVDEVNTLMSCTEKTEENLANHKEIVKRLMGRLEHERKKGETLAARNEALKADLDLWLVRWDDLRLSKRIRDRLVDLPESTVQDLFLLKKEYI